jgi:hypothetical protein
VRRRGPWALSGQPRESLCIDGDLRRSRSGRTGWRQPRPAEAGLGALTTSICEIGVEAHSASRYWAPRAGSCHHSRAHMAWLPRRLGRFCHKEPVAHIVRHESLARLVLRCAIGCPSERVIECSSALVHLKDSDDSERASGRTSRAAGRRSDWRSQQRLLSVCRHSSGKKTGIAIGVYFRALGVFDVWESLEAIGSLRTASMHDPRRSGGSQTEPLIVQLHDFVALWSARIARTQVRPERCTDVSGRRRRPVSTCLQALPPMTTPFGPGPM